MTANHTNYNQKQPEVSNFCNLTEQWKKGELEIDQYYYVKYADGSVETQLYVGGFVMRTDNQVVKVLAPVPSYEEHQQLIKFLEEFNALDVAKENQQLKGYNEYLRNIIKECEPYLENVCIALDMKKFANGGFLHTSNTLLSKIRTAIGEKK